MPNYSYEAVSASGIQSRGSLEVLSQEEAIQRIKEMGLFPIKIRQGKDRTLTSSAHPSRKPHRRSLFLKVAGRIRPGTLTLFTRQLATLVNAGMPLLRGLRLLQNQERNPKMKRAIGEIALAIESGSSMAEALATHPKVFNRLYINMVRAGEIGGMLEQTLRRQADFMEKAEQIKGKVKAALFYPAAVMVVAIGIVAVLMVFVIPRFQDVFNGLLQGRQMPGFTMALFHFSEFVRSQILTMLGGTAVLVLAGQAFIHTHLGRQVLDRLKLSLPVLGPLFVRISLARFTRTLGTLLTSGVPILQALNIVKETTGNVVVGGMVGKIHDSVKEGGTVSEPLKAAKLFPDMVGGMVDVGEQTGALPEMLMKIADTSDQEVDNAVTAMTSLLEPVMIVFLAAVVGSIVIAMFLPLLAIIQDPSMGGADGS